LFKNKTILVTGGTGSFGKKFAKRMLSYPDIKKIIIYSRDEMKQWNMALKFADLDKNKILSYVIGDVRDKERFHRICQDVDFIVHAAATKIVPTAEYNPLECIKTNIFGAMNVIEVAIEQKVKRIVALSTDKSVNPINLYGATKLCSDKLFIAANINAEHQDTRFAVVRYGNVMGSRGSVIPFFRSLAATGEIPITDIKMTRFMISIEQGIDLVLHAFSDMVGGEIYVRKIPSMKVVDVAEAVCPNAKIKIIGIRPGEKLHEIMVTPEDSRNTFEYKKYFKILPSINNWNQSKARIKNGVPVKEGFSYASDNNKEWMKIGELRAFLSTKEYLELEE
jgi:UDP-N-acetylglucosamine 4,6-dehydratase/5-epimerase